jgi:hypothetical protein
MRSWFSVFVKSAFMALLLFVPSGPGRADQSFTSEPLTITRADGRIIPFTVELALTAAEREQGLMNRDQMPIDHGMLFDFGEARQVLMWMKDTILPLDMVFISRNGSITYIRRDTQPFSEDIIDSRGPVYFVLEINAGLSQEYQLKPGDKVSSARIAKAAQAK